MKLRANFFLMLVAMLSPLWVSSAKAKPITRDLSDSVQIDLVHGINQIADFDGKGHAAQIVYAWRENMNAHGYSVYSVLMLRPETKNDWNLVTFETHDRSRKNGTQIDSITDAPFDGEQAVASVRFLKVERNGRSVPMAITARRDLSSAESYVDAVPVEFSLYLLAENGDAVPGWPYYYFDRTDHFRSDRRYCNSDMALAQELRLPLPQGYEGPKTKDGCGR